MAKGNTTPKVEINKMFRVLRSFLHTPSEISKTLLVPSIETEAMNWKSPDITTWPSKLIHMTLNILFKKLNNFYLLFIKLFLFKNNITGSGPDI